MLSWSLLAAAFALAFAVWRFALGYPKPHRRLAWLLRNETAFLDAAADAMFLDGGPIPLSGRDADLPRYLDRIFADLHPRKRLQVRLLLLMMEHATLLLPAPGRFGFRRFSSLGRERRVEVLRSWSESRLFLRRMTFSALRAILAMGYLGHPVTLRHLHLAPYDISSPICEADRLYPRIGQLPADNPLREAELSAPSDGTPIDLEGPLHPDFVESPL